jgi:hypothetical protein
MSNFGFQELVAGHFEGFPNHLVCKNVFFVTTFPQPHGHPLLDSIPSPQFHAIADPSPTHYPEVLKAPRAVRP